jgi:hypothetical protein
MISRRDFAALPFMYALRGLRLESADHSQAQPSTRRNVVLILSARVVPPRLQPRRDSPW